MPVGNESNHLWNGGTVTGGLAIADAASSAKTYLATDASGNLLVNGSAVGGAQSLTDRGIWSTVTSYNVGDIVHKDGGAWYVRTAYTSTSFFSTANLIPLGAVKHQILAWDYGVRGDFSASSASANVAGIQAAIDAANLVGGGTVVLPFGGIITNAKIVMKQYVRLVGSGIFGTYIQLTNDSNCDIIGNLVSTGSGTPNHSWTQIENMTLDGRSTLQTGAGPYHGISFATNPTTAGQTGVPSTPNPEWFDPNHRVNNVRIYKVKGNGVNITGRSAIQLSNIIVDQADGYGFKSSFDTNFTHCEVSGAGLSGFYLNNGSIRIAACKAYTCGRLQTADGAGFYLGSNANGVVISGSEAQNNYTHGFQLSSANRCSITGVADSNDLANGGYAAVLLDAASYNLINVVAWQGTQGGVQVGNQNYALKHFNGSDKNAVTMTHSAAAGASVTGVADAANVYSSSIVRINAVAISDPLGAHSDTLISTPTDGQSLVYNTASGKWLNGAPGAGSTFASGLFGDGSVGTVTFDGAATITGASRSGSTYTLTRDLMATDATVNAGVTVLVAGYRIFCTGTFTNAGTVSANGGAGTSLGVGGTSSGFGTLLGGVAGQAGNTGAGTAGSNNSAIVLTYGVGSTGAGGAGSSGAGGAAAFASNANTFIYKSPQIPAVGVASSGAGPRSISGGCGGGGGGGDGVNKGGGGGCGGGIVCIFARTIVNSGAINARGGDGGTPAAGNCGGGAGGGGGLILLYALSAWTNTGSTSVVAGGFGIGVGTGTSADPSGVGSVLNVVLS